MEKQYCISMVWLLDMIHPQLKSGCVLMHIDSGLILKCFFFFFLFLFDLVCNDFAGTVVLKIYMVMQQRKLLARMGLSCL